MAATLDFNYALKLARSLTTAGHPRSEDALNETAQDLVRWCQGAFIDGEIWSPEAQAQWLVTEVRETWHTWTSTADMKDLLYQRFYGKTLNPERQTIDLGPKPSVECSRCQDYGTVWTGHREIYCDCVAGDNYRKSGGFLFGIPPSPKPNSGFKPITQADFDRLKEESKEPDDDKPNS